MIKIFSDLCTLFRAKNSELHLSVSRTPLAYSEEV